jgi:hypothetical protein
VPAIVVFALGGVAVVAFYATWLLRSGRSQAVRALALAVDVGLLWIGASVAAQWDRSEVHWPAYVIVGSLLAGAAVHALGVVVWRGALAWGARVVGFVLVCGALLVPSTITLVFPLVGLLLVTLWLPAGRLKPV